MPKSILVPVALDHDSLVPAKLALARRLLDEGGQLTLVTVLERIPSFTQEFVTIKSENHLSQRILTHLNSLVADEPNAGCKVVTGKAGMAISELAEEMECDLIIVGSHSPGLQDYFLGSTASRVVRRAPCSVLVVRE